MKIIDERKMEKQNNPPKTKKQTKTEKNKSGQKL